MQVCFFHFSCNYNKQRYLSGLFYILDFIISSCILQNAIYLMNYVYYVVKIQHGINCYYERKVQLIMTSIIDSDLLSQSDVQNRDANINRSLRCIDVSYSDTKYTPRYYKKLFRNCLTNSFVKLQFLFCTIQSTDVFKLFNK